MITIKTKCPKCGVEIRISSTSSASTEESAEQEERAFMERMDRAFENFDSGFASMRKAFRSFWK